MVKERKTFDFMGIFKVEVQMRDDVPSGFGDEAVAGVYDEPKEDKNENPVYIVWFKHLPCGYAITHESWHLFCTMMAHIDTNEHNWLDINNEIYAYNFHVLHCNLLETLTGMKWYKKLYDEREKGEG